MTETEILSGDHPEIAGWSEAAAILGVATGNLERVAGLPPPIAHLKSGKVWLAEPLRQLAKERKARKK